MKTQTALLLLAGLSLGNSAWAEDAAALLDKYNCHVCHQSTGKRVVGPSFKMIAERYSGDTTAVDYLTQRVRSGGPGGWGRMPMPAAPPKASDAEIKAMVIEILSAK